VIELFAALTTLCR